MLVVQDGKYDVGGGRKFETLRLLVEYYRHNPMVEQSGTVVPLKQPFNATRITARGIGKRVKELSVSGGQVGGGREGSRVGRVCWWRARGKEDRSRLFQYR